MVERPLSMREVPGSIPGFSNCLNPTNRIFLNFAISCVLSCFSNVDNIKKNYRAVFVPGTHHEKCAENVLKRIQ